jgi:hypothetical protein
MYKNWGFFYGQGTNRNTLSVRKDGKPVFQSMGIADLHISAILNPDASEDKLPAIDVVCEE